MTNKKTMTMATPHARKRSTKKRAAPLPALPMTVPEPVAPVLVVDECPRCELCGEPAGEGGALCPACAESRYVPVEPVVLAVDEPVPVRVVISAGAVESGNGSHEALVAAVRAHAVKHYSNGWDVVVESWSDDEIHEVVRYATFPRGAINLMARKVKASSEVRDEQNQRPRPIAHPVTQEASAS